MKIRIASSVALAAAIALGATGCGLIAPQSTLQAYAPSDGIDINVGDVKLRNVMLIADQSGENFNVVFGAVNTTGQDQDVTIEFSGEGSNRASADFTIPEGNTLFGDPEGDEAPVLVTIPNLKPGATITANFQVSGSSEAEANVTVLDGTLPEYKDYVLPASFSQEADETSTELKTGAEDEKAAESTINDDQQQ